MHFGRFATAVGALILLSSCGEGGTTAPPPIGTPTPTPPPPSMGIPPRAQTTAYAAGFTPDQDRQLEGFQSVIGNIETGATLPGGGAEIASSVFLNEKGPRSSDGERFTGGIIYTAGDRSVSYVDSANDVVQFRGDATSFVSGDGMVEWTSESEPSPNREERLIWGRPSPFNQLVPQFYSFVRHEERETGSVTRRMFFGGSLTESNDLPPSGVENQRARLLLQSDEPGNGSYQLAGEADLRIDYNTGLVTGTFALQPVQDSLAQPVTLQISGNIDRGNSWIRAGITGGGTGRFAGAFFGPYGSEIAASVVFERDNGQSYYGDLEARRP